MSAQDRLLTLKAGKWYSWEMLPGYAGRYYSPIKVGRVTPLKTGQNVLRLGFFNACYAAGAQSFDVDLKMLYRGEEYLIAKIVGDPQHDLGRCAIITPIDKWWMFDQLKITRDTLEQRGISSTEPTEIILEKLFMGYDPEVS